MSKRKWTNSRLIRSAQQIIHGNLMKISQLNQRGGGDIDITALVIAVDALAAGENLSHLGLGHILILPQIADSGIIGHTFTA